MGGSSSSEQKVSTEQKEVESLAASAGALPMLHQAFSKLADPQSNTLPLQSLQQCFFLTYKTPVCESPTMPESFPGLLDHLGASIVDTFFVPKKGGLSWIEFLRGYVKCCGRMPASMSLNNLLRVFAATMSKAGFPSKLEFVCDDDDEAQCKISGSLKPIDVLLLLWMCWTMSWSSRTSKFSEGKGNLYLPDIDHLVLSAVVSCAEVGGDFNAWDCDILGLEVEVPAGKFLTWVLTTVPTLADCLTQFVRARLQNPGTSEDVLEHSSASVGDNSSSNACDIHLLNWGRAWAISLTIRDTISEEILRACFPINGDGLVENLLYRSSLHGKGLNRFWSNVEGYHGPLLMLVSASSGDAQEGGTNVRRWIIGALTQQGFENRDMFYGSSGHLFAIYPVFHVFPPSGKEKNFVYSHLHPTGRAYEPHPKPEGIAFGGTIGNERIFIDEDFARVTVRHHAVDKTYQSGSLFPYQGFLPVEALILEVEVWGLGSKTAKEVQTSYKKREQLFTEQRRKIDLKTFASWDDSPEKMMMDMVSNPNAVKKEDR